jgi:hypothetical protein
MQVADDSFCRNPGDSGENMRELAGKTAFVTGGAGGIGFALGRAFAQAGMKVMLADIEADALAAAEASYQAFGNVHVVCNNAGVAAGGGIRQYLARQLAMGARRQSDGSAARHPQFPSAYPRPRRRRSHRQYRVDGRDEWHGV